MNLIYSLKIVYNLIATWKVEYLGYNILWWGFNSEALGNVEYLFIGITPRFTVSSSTC